MKQRSIKILVLAAIIGLIVGVIFIFIQPLFGMPALTQRHAEGYMKLSTMSQNSARLSAWLVHLCVSINYGIASALALLIGRKILNYSLLILFLSWVTTVIAPPANAFLVKLIGTKSLPSLSGLPAMNFNVDAKLILHLLFFTTIAVVLWCYQRFLIKKQPS